MLAPNIFTNECKDCSNLNEVINSIDCFITQQGEILNNNYKFGFKHRVKDISLLSKYKNIVVKRIFNPSYLKQYDIRDILHKIKQIINS